MSKEAEWEKYFQGKQLCGRDKRRRRHKRNMQKTIELAYKNGKEMSFEAKVHFLNTGKIGGIK